MILYIIMKSHKNQILINTLIKTLTLIRRLKINIQNKIEQPIQQFISGFFNVKRLR